MPDPLAEYHLNYTPYHYTFNNPINFTDPFGLDTTYVIPEVVVTYTPPPKPFPKPSPSGIVQLLYDVDQFLMGSHNPSKTRDADWFERWCIRNFDMNVVKEIGETVGDGRADPTNRNTVRTTDSYQGRTEDKEIIETSAGNNKEIIENNPIVKEYKGFNWSSWEQVEKGPDNLDTFIDASGDSSAIIYGNIDSIVLYKPHTRRNGVLMSRGKYKTLKK